MLSWGDKQSPIELCLAPVEHALSAIELYIPLPLLSEITPGLVDYNDEQKTLRKLRFFIAQHGNL